MRIPTTASEVNVARSERILAQCIRMRRSYKGYTYVFHYNCLGTSLMLSEEDYNVARLAAIIEG